jgi:hypothetical protein
LDVESIGWFFDRRRKPAAGFGWQFGIEVLVLVSWRLVRISAHEEPTSEEPNFAGTVLGQAMSG